MRIGLMVGPERGRYGTKVASGSRPTPAGRRRPVCHRVDPPDPRRVRRADRRHRDRAETSRIEIGTAVVPVQPRHPIALAQQILSVQAVCEGRLSVGLGVSHHWIIDEMLGLPYEHPLADHARRTSTSSTGRWPARARSTSRTSRFRVHNPLDITDVTPTPVLLAALGPRMLAALRRTDRRDHPVAGRRAGHRLPHRPHPDPCRRGGRPSRPPGGGRHPGVPLRRRRGRRRRGPGQPAPVRGRGLAQLPEAARPRRRPERRRHPGGRQRVGHREAPAGLRRRRGHRPLGPGGADRGGSRGAHRLVGADPRACWPRLATPTSRPPAGRGSQGRQRGEPPGGEQLAARAPG